ncbi:MAG: ATP-NAD kinase family protein [Desulfovibrio sp.]|uniref:ATP-NAD kinase family protein n=1 Tax=Desulfovibrio sp. 7SRBS1 TaxID=3378064 RepID=UPI003B3DFA3D
MLKTAAIVANPSSGKDIRRLVAHGSVFDNQEKVRMVRRLLLGLEKAGVERVLHMPDAYGIVSRAMDSIAPDMRVEAIEMPVRNSQEDTIQAAEIMEAKGAGCMVVLGGDGTSRAACKGTRNLPILPLSTGTNNVFPQMIEATVAGLAAGLVASGQVAAEKCCYKSCLLEICINGQPVDIALVDAAVYADVFIASRAVWDMELVPQLFMTRCRPDSIGLSSVGGQLVHIRPEEPRGLALNLGQGRECMVDAPIGPGMFARVGVDCMEEMPPGKVYPVSVAPCIIAVDGEREVEVKRNMQAGVRLSVDGPLVVDVRATMEYARESGLFVHR